MAITAKTKTCFKVYESHTQTRSLRGKRSIPVSALERETRAAFPDEVRRTRESLVSVLNAEVTMVSFRYIWARTIGLRGQMTKHDYLPGSNQVRTKHETA